MHILRRAVSGGEKGQATMSCIWGSNVIHSLHTGPVKYYVIIGLGAVWVQEMAIFAYYHYTEGGWVRKSPKTCLRNI